MIKFFRKFRRDMLSENKFKNYLIYASGEIVLVVIGILLALQVNAWNQSRLDSSEEKQLFQAIQAKMNHNRFQVAIGFERYNEVTNASIQLIKLSTDELTINSQEDVNFLLHNLTKRFLVGNSNQTSIYDELVGSGKLNLIKSKELRGELTSLKANMELLASYEDLQTSFVDNHLNPFLSKHSDRLTITVDGYNNDTSFYDNIFKESYSRIKILNSNSSHLDLLKDSVFKNLLTELIYHTAVILPIYRRIEENIATIESLTSKPI